MSKLQHWGPFQGFVFQKRITKSPDIRHRLQIEVKPEDGVFTIHRLIHTMTLSINQTVESDEHLRSIADIGKAFLYARDIEILAVAEGYGVFNYFPAYGDYGLEKAAILRGILLPKLPDPGPLIPMPSRPALARDMKLPRRQQMAKLGWMGVYVNPFKLELP